ncbi:putative acyltransferase [Smittium mucronatum]|uniref:Putative acyltransferase n=1 Tax=Smittium mucronatum TaxID=133383 RepID=A0A1R0GQT5_9FUNG|nr:putative acyltransferase [Smittium mucronatum]
METQNKHGLVESSLASFKRLPRMIFLFFAVVPGVVAVLVTLILITPMYYVSRDRYYYLISEIRRLCSIYLVGNCSFLFPTKLFLTIDKSCQDFEVKHGTDIVPSSSQILFKLPDNGIVIANHQVSALLEFVFMDRNWAKDSKNYLDALKDILNKTRNTWLLLFPEGYLFCEETKEPSDRFAKKMNLKPTKHTLLPRVTGLFHAVNTLRPKFPYIYDYTMGYEGIVPGDDHYIKYSVEKVLYEKFYPKNVHLYLRKYKLSDIPENEEEFSQWLYKIWYEKDDLLDYFYKFGEFPKSLDSIELDLKKKGFECSKNTLDEEMDEKSSKPTITLKDAEKSPIQDEQDENAASFEKQPLNPVPDQSPDCGSSTITIQNELAHPMIFFEIFVPFLLIYFSFSFLFQYGFVTILPMLLYASKVIFSVFRSGLAFVSIALFTLLMSIFSTVFSTLLEVKPAN